MKTFIALIFIGTLTYASAGIENCKNETPMKDFSATSFFTGTWYVSHVQKETSKTVCQTFNTRQEGTTLIVEYTFGSGGNQKQVRCEAEREAGVQKLTFSCKVNGKPTFDAVFVIMGTDYNDYAVFYRCVTFTSNSQKNDNYLVLRRKPGQDEIPAGAVSLTSNLGLKQCSELTQTIVL
uniref:Lipocalin-like TiLipo37 n=1 Tax=Triatoma infestans TaxID=30076 RepID=Q6UNA1_TRIIF|nr:lipocalin-like TiLipo37 [Triatoma infestans]